MNNELGSKIEIRFIDGVGYNILVDGVTVLESMTDDEVAELTLGDIMQIAFEQEWGE